MKMLCIGVYWPISESRGHCRLFIFLNLIQTTFLWPKNVKIGRPPHHPHQLNGNIFFHNLFSVFYAMSQSTRVLCFYSLLWRVVDLLKFYTAWCYLTGGAD